MMKLAVVLLFVALACGQYIEDKVEKVDTETCRGECVGKRQCPKNHVRGEDKSGSCNKQNKICCEIKPNMCAQAGGICSKKCPMGYKSIGTKKEKLCGAYKQPACCVPESAIYASCAVRPDPNSAQKVTGAIYFMQKPGKNISYHMDLKGFSAQDDAMYHGIHAHTYGDVSGGCASAGGHFNPEGYPHGQPADTIRHVGDFGNFEENSKGEIKSSRSDSFATLSGPNSIVGRAIVIHGGKDDLGRGGNAGSKASGNAGPRLACCVVGLSGDSHWLQHKDD